MAYERMKKIYEAVNGGSWFTVILYKIREFGAERESYCLIIAELSAKTLTTQKSFKLSTYKTQ